MSDFIFVTGFMGSDRKGLAKETADKLNYKYLDLDEEIDKTFGRTPQRICMLMGEHEYHNKEYEILADILGIESAATFSGASGGANVNDNPFTGDINPADYENGHLRRACNCEDECNSDHNRYGDGNYVISCGDGIIFDDMNYSLISGHRLLIADLDKGVDELWEKAKNDRTLPYAFMLSGNDTQKYEKFRELYDARIDLYKNACKNLIK